MGRATWRRVGGGRSRRLEPAPRRRWRVRQAAFARLRRQLAHKLELQVSLGHYVNCCQLGQHLLAVVQNCYVWFEETQTSAPLWPSVREEMRAAANFVLLARRGPRGAW